MKRPNTIVLDLTKLQGKDIEKMSPEEIISAAGASYEAVEELLNVVDSAMSTEAATYLTTISTSTQFGAALIPGTRALNLVVGHRSSIIQRIAHELSERNIPSLVGSIEGVFSVYIHQITAAGDLEIYKTGNPAGVPVRIKGIDVATLWVGEMKKVDFLKDFPITEIITQEVWDRAVELDKSKNQ